MTEHEIPDFVVIGHVCLDILPGGARVLGGSVSYAATTAHRMGYRVGIVTSTGPDLDMAQAFPFAQVACYPASATTVFENIYLDGSRKQILHQRANVLTCDQIPPAWRQAPMIYLGSIDQEIDPDVFQCFPEGALVGIMPQGFFRRWDEQGVISFSEWTPSERTLRKITVLVISELDVPDPVQLVQEWGRHVDTIVVTRADRGASVYQHGELCHYPARPTQQIDPTGAGDVFAAAFLIGLSETNNPCLAAPFANVVASFSVEKAGVEGIPLRQQVEDYLQTEGEWMLAEH